MTEGERGAYGEWLQPHDTSAFAQQVAAANPNAMNAYPEHYSAATRLDPNAVPIQVASQNQVQTNVPPEFQGANVDINTGTGNMGGYGQSGGGGFRGGQPGYFGTGTGIQNRLLGAIGNWFTGGNPVQQQPPISKAPVNPYIGDDFGGQNRY